MKYRALSEVSTITMGQSPDSSSYNERKEGLPFFQGNADFGEIHPQVRVWCAEPKKTAQKDDILISVRAPIGALNIADRQCCIGRGLASVRVNESVCDRKFLWYALKSKVEELISKGTGSTFKAIGKNVLMSIAIPDIELKDQSTISNKLDIITILINKSKKQLENLDELVKSRFVEMFGDPMENDMEWDMAILDTICDGIGDGLHGTPEYDDNSGYPFINGNNLIDGKITITSTTKFVSCSTYEKHRIDFTDNCILLSINGTLGKVAYYHNEKIMLGKSACYINLKSCVNKTFVFELMRTPFFLRFLDDNSTKSTIKNVGLKAIRGFKLILPPIDVQNQFADFVTKVEKQKTTVQKSIDKLETLKKSLMQEYFG